MIHYPETSVANPISVRIDSPDSIPMLDRYFRYTRFDFRSPYNDFTMSESPLDGNLFASLRVSVACHMPNNRSYAYTHRAEMVRAGENQTAPFYSQQEIDAVTQSLVSSGVITERTDNGLRWIDSHTNSEYTLSFLGGSQDKDDKRYRVELKTRTSGNASWVTSEGEDKKIKPLPEYTTAFAGNYQQVLNALYNAKGIIMPLQRDIVLKPQEALAKAREEQRFVRYEVTSNQERSYDIQTIREMYDGTFHAGDWPILQGIQVQFSDEGNIISVTRENIQPGDEMPASLTLEDGIWKGGDEEYPPGTPENDRLNQIVEITKRDWRTWKDAQAGLNNISYANWRVLKAAVDSTVFTIARFHVPPDKYTDLFTLLSK